MQIVVGHARWEGPESKPTAGTLQETLDAYLQSSRLSPRSREIYAQLVRIQLAPLKDRALGSIRPEEIDTFHNRIAGKAVANSAIRCFRMLFNWAARRDDSLGRNPVRLHKNEWHSVRSKRRPIPCENLGSFYSAVLQLPPMVRDYLLLLLFTGLRRREAAALRWAEVDFERL